MTDDDYIPHQPQLPGVVTPAQNRLEQLEEAILKLPEIDQELFREVTVKLTKLQLIYGPLYDLASMRISLITALNKGQ